MLRPCFVHFLPALFEPAELIGGISVVIDVLRATTTIIHALAAGAASVIPCGEIDEARHHAAGFAGGTVLLGGERGGVRISGFDLDNSPTSYTADRVEGRTLVFTTTNGTRALLRAAQADRVFVAGFVNLHAVLAMLVDSQLPVHVVCAGTDGEVTYEDCLCAGALAKGLTLARQTQPANDEARLAIAAFDSLRGGNVAFQEMLRVSRGGANLVALGLEADIETAGQWDRFNLVPELLKNPWRIEKAAPATTGVIRRWIEPLAV